MSVNNGGQTRREIERKFLVFELLDFGESPSVFPIKQGYLSVGSNGAEIRLRRVGGRYLLTIKEGTGLTRLETEIVLSKEQFETLWPRTEGRRLEKERYEVPCGEVVIQVDIYRGSLEGLVVSEVEFGSVDESKRFEPPGWFGEEVTEDERYKNRNLAVFGKPAGQS